MISICHPIDDMELLFLQSALEASDIPYFVVGQYLGSLYPGMQIPWYNERSIQVPVCRIDEALELIQHLRSTYSPPSQNLSTKSKLCMLFEALYFGWIIPGGSKKTSEHHMNEVIDSPDKQMS